MPNPTGPKPPLSQVREYLSNQEDVTIYSDRALIIRVVDWQLELRHEWDVFQGRMLAELGKRAGESLRVMEKLNHIEGMMARMDKNLEQVETQLDNTEVRRLKLELKDNRAKATALEQAAQGYRTWAIRTGLVMLLGTLGAVITFLAEHLIKR
jgi:hypothetical protein